MLKRCAGAILGLVGVAHVAAAQSMTGGSFVTTRGNDTLAIEQYSRQGNTITGDWVSNQGSTQLHHYVLTLGPDGLPARYEMNYSVPGLTAGPGTLRSVVIAYGSDSTTYVTTVDTVITTKVAMKGAYPFLGKSVVGLELALSRLRTAHVDSSSIVVNLPTGPVYTPIGIPVKFAGRDSAVLAGSTWVRFDPDGRLLRLAAGPMVTRRVTTLDVAHLVAGFVAAHAAADAVHHEITLPATALDRFVGEYSLNATVVFAVSRDGDHLVLQATGQPAVPLSAESPTRFYAKAVGASLEFQVDAAGNATAVVIVQGGTRERAPRQKS